MRDADDVPVSVRMKDAKDKMRYPLSRKSDSHTAVTVHYLAPARYERLVN